jgi:hypothetical protein
MDEEERRERVLGERLEALDWCILNIDRLEDRLVKAYVLKLKRLIGEEEKRGRQEERPAIPALSPNQV